MGNNYRNFIPPISPAPRTVVCTCRNVGQECPFNCILRPYFPEDNPQKFLNVHRLYGIRRIHNWFQTIDPACRDHFMASIIYEANARATHPVGGCTIIICALKEKIDHATAQLKIARQLLENCRAAAAAAAPATTPKQQLLPPPDAAGDWLSTLGDVILSPDAIRSILDAFASDDDEV